MLSFLARIILASALFCGVANAQLPTRSNINGGCSTVRPLPMDAVSGVWSAGYGVCSLTTKWLNGPLFDVTAQSRTVTIQAVNGIPDVKKLASLMGVNYRQGIGGLAISKWYDQSGNGNNCTQGTTANQPWVWLINGKVYVAGDGMLLDYINQTAGSDKFCNFPAGMTTNNVAQSVFATVQMGVTGNAYGFAGNYDSNLYTTGTGIGNPGDGILISAGSGGAGNTQWFAINWVDFDSQSASQVVETQPLVLGVVSGPSSFVLTQNEESYSGAALTGTGTTTGGSLMSYAAAAGGAGSSTNGFYGRMQSFMIAGTTALTPPQQTAMRNANYALFGINKSPTISVLVDGASIDDGTGASIGTSNGTQITGVMGYGWAEHLRDLTPYQIRWGNTAVYGSSVENLTTNFATSQCTFYNASYSKNILIAPGGALANSISGGDTAAQAYTALTNYLTAAETCGWSAGNIYVSLVWQVPTGAAVTLNNTILANAASLGIKVMGPTTLGTGNPGPGCPMSAPLNTVAGTTNSTYYNQSPANIQGHPTVIGYDVYAKCYWPQVIQQAIGP